MSLFLLFSFVYLELVQNKVTHFVDVVLSHFKIIATLLIVESEIVGPPETPLDEITEFIFCFQRAFYFDNKPACLLFGMLETLYYNTQIYC